MNKIASKIISIICALCMALAVCPAAFAEDSVPEVSITLDKSGKTATIGLKNVGFAFYSAQITLDAAPQNASFTITPKSSSSYGVVKEDSGSVTLYIDSTDLLDGTKTVSLATLKATREVSFGKKAEVTLVNRSMYPVSYDDVKVSTTKSSSTSSTGSGSGGGTGGLGGLGGSNVFHTGNTGNTGNTNTNSNSGGDNTGSTPTVGGFTDVSGHWAEADIRYVTEKGLFNGMSATTFEPYSNMTRAMFVTVLSRLGDKVDQKWNIPCDNPMKFDDVPDGMWYSDAVAWAGGTGVVNGMGENMFAPNAEVTREQMAVMIVNFAALAGTELPKTKDAADVTDEAAINGWAKDAVHAAQQAGIINGRDSGAFDPQATATRAEVAAILHRFAEAF